VVSQPTDKNCNVPAPGEVDETLHEFWSGNPWSIFQKHNLSSFERNRAYLNVRGESFIEISALTAADLDSDSRGAMGLDLRNNGRLDLVVRQVSGGPLKIFENRISAGRYLKVSLRGARSNRLGVGARLVARFKGRQVARELFPANSFKSQTPALVHFGLDDAEVVDDLTVRWPSGLEQVIRNVPADQHVVIDEGQARFETVLPGRLIAP
jgi:hypothetical protein